ncbi:hypothetical protein HYX07_04325 [Candidatus Woesearchaeota archaeon]|nr:hypothetical protein [Candidatus Woesearchaeota archaeon]
MSQVLELSEKSLTLDDVLLHGTATIDVIAILKAGRHHARTVLSAIGSRGEFFGIDPHELDHYGEPFFRRKISDIVFPLAPQGFTYVDDPETYQPPEWDYTYFGFSEEQAQKLKAEEPKPLKFPERMLPNRQNSAIICDDVIEGVKHTFDKVKAFMAKHLSYDFRSDNPLHFGAVENVGDFDTVSYTGRIGNDKVFW